jgi:Fe-S-cluster-containing hydrogenase component 2
MVIDTRMCVDCDNCVTACERRHGTSRLDRSNAGLQIGHYQVPASCYHCNDPVCLLCAVDGIVREPSGEIRINSDNCIGCGACAERCPYDNIQMVQRDGRTRPFLQRILPKPIFELLGIGTKKVEDFERVAVKCDLCAGYASGPACVRSCPTGAAQRANPLELFRR